MNRLLHLQSAIYFKKKHPEVGAPSLFARNLLVFLLWLFVSIVVVSMTEPNVDQWTISCALSGFAQVVDGLFTRCLSPWCSFRIETDRVLCRPRFATYSRQALAIVTTIEKRTSSSSKSQWSLKTKMSILSITASVRVCKLFFFICLFNIFSAGLSLRLPGFLTLYLFRCLNCPFNSIQT